MAVTIRNILVGAGNMYIAAGGTVLPAAVAGTSMNTTLATTAGWRHVGATQEGVEIGYEPDYGEVEVDQLKDAAILFNQGVTVTMGTNLAEATLQNLVVAWGQADAAVVANTADATGATETLPIAVPGEAPVERACAVVGRAPATDTGARRERIYYARRVVSMEASSHSLRRTEATVFPISFRLLPNPQYSGAEYGTIVDRIV